MRLQAYLARSGRAPSRRKAEKLILDGRVEINGRAASLGACVSNGDRVLLDGRPVKLPPTNAYLALNKPKGYLTTLGDDRGRPTVADLMPQGPKTVPGLVPIGRLDADTTGLLLLTNDGPLAHRVAHPSSEVEKEYELTLAAQKDLEDRLDALKKGPALEDGPMLPPGITRPRHGGKNKIHLNLTVHEGRNRIIRRACAAVGLRLLSLRRVRVGPVTLGDLPEGQLRRLTGLELEGLRDGA